ncbi:MAG: amidohydrolase family protein, partial [Eubacteriales bacterium]
LELGLKGVKLHPDIQKFSLDSEGSMSILGLCDRYELPVLIHAGDKRFQNSNPDNIIPVLERFPNLTMIGAHFGGFSVWDEALERLSKYPNYYVDCSSSMFAMDDEKVMALIAGWGTDRILFATDYPMWSPAAERKRYEGLPLTEVQKFQMDYQNAMRILKLSPEILKD